MSKVNIQQLIKQGRTADALAQMAIDVPSHLKNDVLNLQNQLSEVQREINLGLIDFNDASLRRNRILNAILDILRAIPEEEGFVDATTTRRSIALPDIQTLNGEQAQAFTLVLVNAFPNIESLRQFTRFQLNTNLNTISGDNNIQNVAFALLERFETDGRLRFLIEKTYETRPENPAVVRFIQSLT